MDEKQEDDVEPEIELSKTLLTQRNPKIRKPIIWQK
jgi:hypothetical protein